MSYSAWAVVGSLGRTRSNWLREPNAITTIQTRLAVVVSTAEQLMDAQPATVPRNVL